MSMKTRLLIIGIIVVVVGTAGYLVFFYDLAPTTTVNNFGISARIIHGFDDRIMCPTGPCYTSIYLMHINSEMPGFVTGYNVCKGLACIINADLQVFVGPENDPRNQIVYLSNNVPWQVGDIVNIRLDVSDSVSVDGKNYPDSHKSIHLDLGNSMVVEQNNPYSSSEISENDTNQKDVEQQPLTIEGLNKDQILGEKITFTVKFNGTKHGCYSYPLLWIENSDHQKMWVSNTIVELCDPDTTPTQFETEWKIGDSLLGIPIINSTGYYTLFAEFENNKIQKDFLVKF